MAVQLVSVVCGVRAISRTASEELANRKWEVRVGQTDLWPCNPRALENFLMDINYMQNGGIFFSDCLPWS